MRPVTKLRSVILLTLLFGTSRTNPMQNVENSPVFTASGLFPQRLRQSSDGMMQRSTVWTLQCRTAYHYQWTLCRVQSLTYHVIPAAVLSNHSQLTKQEAFEKCWAHSPLRAAARPFTRCRH